MHTIDKWIGNTVLLHNYRKDGIHTLLRITRIRDTHDEPIQPDTLRKNIITRGRYLITGIDLDQGGVIQSFYLNHGEFKRVGFFGRLRHRILKALNKRLTRDD